MRSKTTNFCLGIFSVIITIISTVAEGMSLKIMCPTKVEEVTEEVYPGYPHVAYVLKTEGIEVVTLTKGLELLDIRDPTRIQMVANWPEFKRKGSWSDDINLKAEVVAKCGSAPIETQMILDDNKINNGNSKDITLPCGKGEQITITMRSPRCLYPRIQKYFYRGKLSGIVDGERELVNLTTSPTKAPSWIEAKVLAPQEQALPLPREEEISSKAIYQNTPIL